MGMALNEGWWMKLASFSLVKHLAIKVTWKRSYSSFLFLCFLYVP